MRQSYTLGGWVMSNEETIRWAARVGEPLVGDRALDSLTFYQARTILGQYLLRKYNIRISLVYPDGNELLMVVTRRRPHLNNWKRGDDPAKLVMEPYQQLKIDVAVGKLLEKDGVRGHNFITTEGLFPVVR